MNTLIDCPLCRDAGGLLVANTPLWRVVRVTDTPAFPAFYRLIWNRHAAEFSELGAAERADCMEGVARIEAVLRQALQPSKINLASLGNVVPHLHWHLIARFEGDSHFPNPIWGEGKRVDADPLARLALPLAALDERVAAAVMSSE
jgi:diadenosine tetraphosphate (Ap4A) HIT family hydrolase